MRCGGRGRGRLGHKDQARLVATWSLLGLSRLAIAVLPFRVVRRALGEHRAPVAPAAPVEVGEVALDRARWIGVLVRYAAGHTPWRSDCYPQALTARVLLRLARVPHVVSFGVRRDGDALVAHAWVHVGGLVVTGQTGHDYAEVGSFGWAPASHREAGPTR